MRWTQIEPFGVEVTIDLAQPLTPTERAQLAALRVDHHLLVFRGQSLTLDQQMNVLSCFGPVLKSRDDGFGYVSNVRADGILGDTELEFHSDQDYSPLGAYYVLSLHAVEVEDDRTSTVFCSAVRALETLPPATLRRLYALEALDVQLRDLTGRNRLHDSSDDRLRCVHPLIRHLPFSGRPALYASRSGTDRICGLDEAESEALLAELFEHLYRPANLHEHRWRTGDLLVWDNRALQHRRGAIPAGTRRTLQRVSCAEPGTGIFDAFPQLMQRSSYATAAAE